MQKKTPAPKCWAPHTLTLHFADERARLHITHMHEMTPVTSRQYRSAPRCCWCYIHVSNHIIYTSNVSLCMCVFLNIHVLSALSLYTYIFVCVALHGPFCHAAVLRAAAPHALHKQKWVALSPSICALLQK